MLLGDLRKSLTMPVNVEMKKTQKSGIYSRIDSCERIDVRQTNESQVKWIITRIRNLKRK